MRLKARLISLLLVFAATAHEVSAAEQTIRIGGICDRTGATKLSGGEACPGVADYIALVNRAGGVMGQKLEYTEFDHAYMVDRAADAYDRLKERGVVVIFNYGVPILYGLTSRYMADRIPAFAPGTGRSDAIDGETWPFIFPGTASYWSQAGVAMKYLKDSGARSGTRIAYLYLDSPAGREGIPMIETVAQREGYLVRFFAVQPPGIEMDSQVGAITRDFRADWVVTSLFGRPPSVAIRALKAAGFPLNRVIGFVWGAGDADIEEAGWDIAQGYLGLQFAAVGRDHPLISDLRRMHADEGREVPKYLGSVYYNRGVLTGAIIVEGIRLAIKDHGLPVTGDSVRKGLEAIKNFDMRGFAPPLTITPQDHEGGGYLKVYQVSGNAWVPVSDWISAYRNEVMALVREANKK
jgi:branched-chain amino acid transport system substrate-binding protein